MTDRRPRPPAAVAATMRTMSRAAATAARGGSATVGPAAGIPDDLSVAQHVEDLARQHRVSFEPGALDAFASSVTRLSDAEPAPDRIENLLDALRQAGVLSANQRFALHAAYLREVE